MDKENGDKYFEIIMEEFKCKNAEGLQRTIAFNSHEKFFQIYISIIIGFLIYLSKYITEITKYVSNVQFLLYTIIAFLFILTFSNYLYSYFLGEAYSLLLIRYRIKAIENIINEQFKKNDPPLIWEGKIMGHFQSSRFMHGKGCFNANYIKGITIFITYLIMQIAVGMMSFTFFHKSCIAFLIIYIILLTFSYFFNIINWILLWSKGASYIDSTISKMSKNG